MKKISNLFNVKANKIEHQISKVFDQSFYTSEYPDLANWKGNVLSHYLRFGILEGRSPNMLFDPEWYLRMNPDLPEGTEALKHYLTQGEIEGRWPHPLFDPRWYLKANPDVAAHGVSPLQHFLTHGVHENREFSPFLSVAWYNAAYPDVAQQGIHPAIHFLTTNDLAQFDPGTHFSSSWYCDDNPDVRATGVHPYIHYLKHGQYEGRPPVPHILIGGQSAHSSDHTFDLATLSPPLGANDREPGAASWPAPISIDTSPFKLASFDVWSTLLHRDCHPDEIKLQSARYLQLVASEDIKPAFSSLRDILSARIRSENRSAPNGDFEYKFADAIDPWLLEVLHPTVSKKKIAELRNGLLNHELLAELRSTRPDTNTSQFIDKLKIPYIFASDFYMSADFIAKLLSTHKIGGNWVKGYSSSDSFENKRGGKLFSRILSDLHLEPSDMLHVGDNPHADGAIPQSMGISALSYEDEAETKRLNWYGEGLAGLLEGDLTVHHRRILALLEDCSKQSSNEGTAGVTLFQIGVQIAPIVFSFCLSVLEDAVKRKCDTVFFFTREGIFFREVYEAIVKADAYNVDYPAASTLAVSRRATFAASLRSFDVNELMRLWSMYSAQSPRGFASSLNLDDVLVRRVAERHGVGFETQIAQPWSDKAFQKMMKDPELSEHAKIRISQQRVALLGYLEQEGFLGQKPGKRVVVDIGWRGTIQDNISRLIDRPLNGHYFALFKFLNKQHPGGSKTGWLGDDNLPLSPSIPDQVAPLEMIFNGEGGSVVGYEEMDGIYRAIKEVTRGEEEVVAKLRPLKAGMLAAIPQLTRYVRLHGLAAEHLKSLSRKLTIALIQAPPADVADLFGILAHNETFGVGHIENVGNDGELANLPGMASPSPRTAHYAIDRWLGSVRWKEGAVRQTKIASWWQSSPQAVRSSAPSAVSRLYSPAVAKVTGERLAIYAPAVLKASGGHRTIFNMTKKLAEVGLEPYIFTDGVGQGLEVVEEYMAGTRARIHTNWRHPISSCVAFATIAHSAAFVRHHVESQHKFYLVQDYEALFNPVGDAYALAENSYAQGLNHVTIGNWLTQVLRSQYNAKANPAGLGVDTDIYKIENDNGRERAICMLYQPEKPRRGNALALAALKMLKEQQPDVKIFLYGSDERVDTGFDAEQLGTITQLSELNDLYNRCRTGICISLSNPSRIPFEMMAAGCIPVDLFRYNNLMDYETDTAILAYQNPESIALALQMALDRNKQEGADTALAARTRTRTLKWENDTIAGHVLGTIAGDYSADGIAITKAYENPPVLADDGDLTSAQAFCAWQRKLADGIG